MSNLLIYRRLSDKKNFKKAHIDFYIRVGEFIPAYARAKATAKDPITQVFITEEATQFMPDNRLILIEKLFGKVIISNGLKVGKLTKADKLHLGIKYPGGISPQQKQAARKKAAKVSAILKEKPN